MRGMPNCVCKNNATFRPMAEIKSSQEVDLLDIEKKSSGVTCLFWQKLSISAMCSSFNCALCFKGFLH